jgi:very-short-patch-repair endonuclease
MSCNWGNVNIKYLVDNFNLKPLKVISTELGMEYYCILNKSKELGLSINNPDYVTEGWGKIKNYVRSLDMLPYEDVKNFLLENYTKYIGRSGNRILTKEYPKMFNSIYCYTNKLGVVKDKNSKSFVARIIFIIKHDCDLSSTKCECGSNTSFKQKHSPYKDYEYNFQPFCIKCQPKYPSEKYLKFKYGENWESFRDRRRRKLSKLKTNSKGWFMKKYGDEWETPYIEYYNKKIKQLHENNSKLNNDRYSKISQELFNDIYKQINNKEKVYYATNNGEYFINLKDDYKIKLNKHCIKPDFMVSNKIIEFNGEYWHSKTKEDDKIRYSIMKDLGYEVLVVEEKQYKENKLHTIKKCVDFINGK